MSRPSFQFYPGDWQKNANLRRCSPAARGVWVDILCLLHDSEAEYGVLRWPLKDVANAASAPMPLVKELVSKGVLKGADKDAEAYVYRPKHAGKVGEPVVLVMPGDGPVWYSSRFVRDEYVRQKRGESTRFDTANQPGSRSPKGGIGEPHGDGPSSSSSPSGSVPNGTAGQPAAGGTETPTPTPPPAPTPPPPPKSFEDQAKADLWRAAVSVLQAGGCEEEAVCRSFMGKLVKDYTFPVVQQAVAAAASEQPAEAREYLKATCQRLKGERKDPVTVDNTADRERAQAELRRQAEHDAAIASQTPEQRQAIAEKLAATRKAMTSVTQPMRAAA